MRRNTFFLASLIVTGLVTGTSLMVACTSVNTAKVNNVKMNFESHGNPFLPLWEHMPDGEPHVFEDPENPGQYRVYIYGSHDTHGNRYCGLDVHAWSASVDNLTLWRDEGSIFTFQKDGKWDTMYAPDICEIRRKDGTVDYFLYPHSRGPKREAMVAKGSSPVGPFTPINLTTDGKATVKGSIFGFDPGVYVEYITDPNDPDYAIGYRAYGYWGFQKSNAAELDPNTMYSVRPGKEVLKSFIPASKAYGEIKDPEGTTYPAIMEGEDLKAYNFFEASSMRRVGNKYVWIYSGYSGPDYGVSSSNSTLRYAYGDTPLGPWKSGGVLVDSRAPVLSEDGSTIVISNSGHNTHGSIEKIGNQWYCFYHRPTHGGGHARQAMVAPIYVHTDEIPVSEGGKVVITAYDPYKVGNSVTCKAADGNEYKGAEVTSEGVHIYGLDPYKYYSAGYACYFSNDQVIKDSWDIWDNHMPLEGIENGNIIGYKYFGFGGLNEAKNGLKPFEGTKVGNGTTFNLWLTPRTTSAFDVEIWLDGPFENMVWNGKKIATISIPTDTNQTIKKYSVDVASTVDKLEGKHAIYLVTKGVPNTSLCDIVGLGFSKIGKTIERPNVPSITIKVDGTPINLPKQPVKATNENGIVDYSTYDYNYTISPNSTKVPTVTAMSDSPKVKFEISPAKTFSDITVVKCDYNGIVKKYNIKFNIK